MNQEEVIFPNKDEDFLNNTSSHYNMQEDILKSKERIEPFIDAITKNPHLFKDKIVLEINCGTGLLSILAAQNGATQVYATESTNIAYYTQKIIEENDCKDKVTILKGRIEELELPVEAVDIIVCQWMGHFLLFDSTIQSVIYARDKYLVQDGIIMPDQAVLYIASIEDDEYKRKKFHFWDQAYGVSMKCMKSWVIQEPIIEGVPKSILNSDPCEIFYLDLNTATEKDLNFSNSYRIQIKRNDYVHGLITWFDVFFSKTHLPIKVSTDPIKKNTFWKQSIFYLEENLTVFQDDIISGSIAVKGEKQILNVKISVHLKNRIKSWNFEQYYRFI